MIECPNCGHKSFAGISRCNCTWSEMIAAARVKEKRARESGERKVIVNHLTDTKDKRTK